MPVSELTVVIKEPHEKIAVKPSINIGDNQAPATKSDEKVAERGPGPNSASGVVGDVDECLNVDH